MEEEVKEKVMEYQGNDEKFQEYNKIIDSNIQNAIILKYENNIKKYEGNIEDGEYEGRGKLYNESGEMIYKGFFKKGKYEGFGKEYEKNKLIYIGFFKNGYYEGNGTIYKNNLKIYEGHFLDGYQGVGIVYFEGKKVSKMMYKNGEPLQKGYLILYENNKIIYSGLSSGYNPLEGKNLTIYNKKGYKIYKGDFNNYKYNGYGILYFENSNNIYFNGNFEENNFIDGILYDLDGNKTYEGKFINNIPVEGKNIKLYNIDKYLKYEGDIMNCKYNGKGKLYKYNILLYDGEFSDGIFNGKGKLYMDNKLFYDGQLKNGKFHGKGIIYNKDNLYYEGEFLNDQINGEGIKYYSNGKKHIEGYFEFKNKNEKLDFEFSKRYAKGYLYDYDENKLCETEIVDFIPKEGKNIKLYDKDEKLIYCGDFFDYKYHGKGKLYDKIIKYINRDNNEYILKYEGDFIKGVFEGYGKLYQKYYDNLYYEGNFINGEIKGKGIRFYKNGKKKLEGIFEDNNIFEGKYYSPKEKVIFEGKIINNLLYDSNFQELYNDNGFILYKAKIKTFKNIEDFYNNFELLNNIIFSRDKVINNNKTKINPNENKSNKSIISFTSENYAGKTSLITRFIENKFYEDRLNRTLFGSDFKKYSYIYNNIEYSIHIWNLHGAERFHSAKILYSKKSDIIIYTIDITNYDINEIFINDLYENMEKKYKFIYIVLTKIDLNEKNLELCRKLAQKLIIEGIIYRYFEVSSKTGEGIESFIKCLKFDIDLSCKLNKNINYNIDLSWESDNNSFKKNLDKYLNY